MPTYPSPETWEYASPRQAERARRSFEVLKRRAVPVYWGPLMVADDDEVSIQPAQDVARRLLVLWAVELRAEGVAQAEIFELLEKQNLWPAVSPDEEVFLRDENPDAEECARLTWRSECIWVLLWALGYVAELDWPCEQCDVNKFAEMVTDFEDDPNFILCASLRSTAEILDAEDLILRLNWAVRNVYLHQGGTLPADLDWSGQSEHIPVPICDATGVVQQRHYTLAWLVNRMDPETWDDVDTST